MTIHSAKALMIHVATMDAPHAKEPLQQLFLRRFTLRTEDETARSYAEHAWQVHSAVTQQSGIIEAEIAFSANGAARLVRDAALQAKGVMIYVEFPDGATIEGAFNIRDYEVYAQAGDVLRAAFTAHSRDALVLDLV